MKEIKVADGLQEYRVNDKCTLRFNPADPAFADHIYTAFDTLKKRQEEKDKDVDTLPAEETFAYLRQLNVEMRETIDSVLGEGVCDSLFDSMSVYASAGGTPLWLNLMTAIIDELDEGIKREKAFHSEKLAKYTSKYHR